MSIILIPITAPTVTVSGSVADQDVVQSGLTVTKAPVLSHASPSTVSISGDGVMRYTLNGKNPTLGSTVYTGPFVLRQNGNGHGSDNTILKVKSYVNGVASAITKVEFRLT